jgi:hypothetical protein
MGHPKGENVANAILANLARCPVVDGMPQTKQPRPGITPDSQLLAAARHSLPSGGRVITPPGFPLDVVASHEGLAL